MTATTPARRSDRERPGLLESLLGVVRAEFRVDPLVFAADNPVFGGAACRVDGCQRCARGRAQLCSGHHQRWVDEGRTALDVFAASTDRLWRRQRPNAACRVEGCGYGVAREGMCQLHFQRWERAGRPDLAGWLADPPAVKLPAPGSTCGIGHCRLWPQAALPLCHAHASTWRANGRPDVEAFIGGFTEPVMLADETIRLDVLGRQLALEVQYVLQCRYDERAAKLAPAVVMRVVRFLAATTAVSLLDHSEDSWRGRIARHAPKDANARALLVYARRKVEDLADAGGWEAEFPRDIWQLRRLGVGGNQALDFAPIPQPWLRQLVKRWRLGTGLNLETVRRGLRALTRFSLFCDGVGVTGLADIDRIVIERYLADLHAELAGRQRHGDTIGQLNSFLHAIRQHRWDDSLSPGALVFSDDYPKRSEAAPRALGEHVNQGAREWEASSAIRNPPRFRGKQPSWSPTPTARKRART